MRQLELSFRTRSVTSTVVCLLCILATGCAALEKPESRDSGRVLPGVKAREAAEAKTDKSVARVFQPAAPLVPARTTEMTQDERDVTQTAQQRWDFLIKGDVNAAYELLSPRYRAINPFSLYASGIKVGGWKEARAVDAQCNAEICEVFIAVDLRVVFPGVGPTVAKSTQRERWIRDAGRWWHVPGS
jgi:hypothetical protein